MTSAYRHIPRWVKTLGLVLWVVLLIGAALPALDNSMAWLDRPVAAK